MERQAAVKEKEEPCTLLAEVDSSFPVELAMSVAVFKLARFAVVDLAKIAVVCLAKYQVLMTFFLARFGPALVLARFGPPLAHTLR